MHARQTSHSTLFSLILCVTFVLSAIRPAAAASPYVPAPQLSDEEIANRVADIRAEAPDIEDNFDADNGTWDTNYTGNTSIYFRAGKLHLAVDVDSTVAWSESSTRVGDFYMEVESVHQEGPLNNQFGVLFQYEDSDNFLFFAIGSDGYYSLQRLANNEWEMLIEWTESDVIETGEASENVLGILAEGSNVALLINDYIVDQIEVEPNEGKLALAAGAYDEVGVNVAFDNFAVWLLGSDAQGRNGLPIRVPERTDITATPEPATPEPVEPGETVTPEPTTPEPTATPQPGDLRDRIETIRAEAPIYTDNFSAPSDSWSPNQFEGITYGVEEGELLIDIAIPSALGWTLSGQQIDNFYLEVDATHLFGPTAIEYGVIFRYVDPQNFYLFAVSATGEFSLWLLKENQWQTLQEWTTSPAILAESGQVNRLGLLAEGEQIALLVNDQVLLEIADDTFPAGGVGLALGAFAEGNVSVAFDNLALWDLEATGDSLTVPDVVDLPTVEATGTAPVEEPSAASARIEEITAGAPAISDDFRRDEGNWDISLTDNSLTYFQRRSLHIEVTGENWIVWSRYLGGNEEPPIFGDFYTEADMSFVQRPEGATGGLILRLQDSDNFYYYAVDAAGYYSLQKKVGGVWVELVPWTTNDLFDGEEGAVNRIGILLEGDQLAITLNGVVVGEVQDADLDTGTVALMAGAGASAGVEVSFDNFVLWNLSQ